MTDNSKINPLQSLDSTLLQKAEATKKKNDQIGKNEFLNLLVTQLKQQDPMDPMNSDQFAVNLAQFSQLEQLTEINQKLGDSSSTDFSSLASNLGKEVVLSDSTVSVKNSDGGKLRLDMGYDYSDVHVELLNPDNSIKERISLGDLQKGKRSIELSNLNTQSGDYSYRVTGVGASGIRENISSQVSGIVSGFVPGADPSFIVNGNEVKLDSILEVLLPE